MAKKQFRFFLPVVLVFILVNISFLFLQEKWEQGGIDTVFLLVGNTVIFLLTLLSFLMNTRGLVTKNNHAFVRMVYGSFIIKFIVITGALAIYLSAGSKGLNKSAIFICMGLYLVYLFLEITALMKLSKEKKNA